MDPTPPKPWFVFNAASAKVAKKGALLPKIADKHNAILRDVGDFSDVDTLVQDALSAKAEHIVIEGGDGTVQGILTEFLRHEKARNLPLFTLVPGGNTNQVARNVGLKSITPAFSSQAGPCRKLRIIPEISSMTAGLADPWLSLAAF